MQVTSRRLPTSFTRKWNTVRCSPPSKERSTTASRGQRRRWKNVNATWDDFSIAVAEVHDVDDERAVVVLRLAGKAKVSGIPLDTLLGQVWTWRGGKVWRIVTYTEPRDALEAVGLSIDAHTSP